MDDLNKITSPEKKENSTVEVVVKREPEADAAEIDLVRVFENMGKKKKIYAWIIIACLLIGLAAPLLMAEMAEKTGRVSAVITLLYPEAKQQLAPDKTPLDMNYIASSYIIQNALNKAKLSTSIPISAIERNISITSLLSEDTRQRLEVVEKLTDESKDYGEVLNVNYVYEGRYIITLENGFSTDPEARKKTYLEGNDLSNLLNGIVTAYNEYFFETYMDFKLPDNTKDSYASEELDYVERLDNMVELLNALSRYCTDKEKGEFLTYRSLKDGMSLADINECIRLVKDIDVDYLYSYVYFNNISKDADSMLTKFAYTLRNLEMDLSRINDSIADNAMLISEYKNDNIVVSMSEQGTSQVSSSVTDYYNDLIKTQAGYFESKAALNENIANINDLVNGFKSVSTKKAQMKYVANELVSLTGICNSLYDLVEEHASEIINSDFYRNSYVDFIGAQYIDESFFNASTVKKTAIGAAVGLFLGIVIWGMDGLITEIKRGSKEDPSDA
nr:hypothetical protein [Lachnospiraceae bacterium]